MGGTLPGVTTLMSAFDKILSAFNLNNSRGNWFYQTERNKMPMMDDVSPEQAAMFFHTVEVNLNQTTTVVGWVPNTAKVHAIDSKPKAKPKAKASIIPGKGEELFYAIYSFASRRSLLRLERPIRLPLRKRIPEKGRVSMILTRPARLQLTRRV